MKRTRSTRNPTFSSRSLRGGAGALVLALAVSSCGDPTGVEPITGLPRALSAAEAAVIDGSNSFAFGLLREVREIRADSPNTVLSPLSASMALGMAMNGAAGDTWTQMRDALGFEGLEEQEVNGAYRDLIALLLDLDPSVQFGLGNAAWVDEMTLRPDFVERLETFFAAEVGALDFDDPASADVMNEWVRRITSNRIDRLLDQVDPEALLYLLNAVYFKADWRSQFERDRTAAAPFTRSDGSTVQVDMMSGEVGYRTLNVGAHSLVQGVELPYGGGAFSAVAVLPPHGESINAFVGDLEESDWNDWMATFEAAAEEEKLDRKGVLVRLPKFELESGDSLNRPLQALGMTHAFDRNSADFTRITDDRSDLLIYDVIQKTYLRVDEEGTEAAAATSVSIGPTSAPPSLTFDRPFLFAIRERFSGTILFMGVIGDPGA